VSDDEQRFPRFVRKPQPVMATQRLKQQARDELEQRVESLQGARSPGVRDRAIGRLPPRDDSFGARLRERMRPSLRSNTWRV
jgi:hypothetical protein